MFANYMIIVGTIRSFGLVFVGLIEYYGASASLTAVLFSIAGSLSMFCGKDTAFFLSYEGYLV